MPPTGEHENLACHEARMSLGVLVLGVIDPEERPALEAHVAGCATCSAAMAELAVLPGLLHRLDATQAAAGLPEPSPEFTDRLLTAARQARPVRSLSRRLVLSAVAAAAAVLTAGAILLPGVLTADGNGGGRAVVATGRNPRTAVEARVTLTPEATGTRLTLALGGVAPGEHCQLVAVDRRGAREVTATWVASYAGRASVTGTTSFDTADIRRLQVVRTDGGLLANVDVPQAKE